MGIVLEPTASNPPKYCDDEDAEAVTPWLIKDSGLETDHYYVYLEIFDLRNIVIKCNWDEKGDYD